MARSRNIKPGFFRNEDLADCHPLARLLFIGLWCIADREGRLEDRPKRIKADCLPYDDADADALLAELAAKGFIVRYMVDGTNYIAIPTFTRHQNPHVKEPPSVIPAPDKSGASPVQEPDKPGSGPADSLLPLTDSLSPDSLIGGPPSSQDQPPRSEPLSSTASRKRAADSTGTRLPDGWKPDEELMVWARLERPDADLDTEVDAFVDYWRATPGAKGRKTDWNATFRNWVRRANSRPAVRMQQVQGRYGGTPTLPERQAAAMADFLARNGEHPRGRYGGRPTLPERMQMAGQDYLARKAEEQAGARTVGDVINGLARRRLSAVERVIEANLLANEREAEAGRVIEHDDPFASAMPSLLNGAGT
jgi:hypothetical protein